MRRRTLLVRLGEDIGKLSNFLWDREDLPAARRKEGTGVEGKLETTTNGFVDSVYTGGKYAIGPGL
jgi:hypothetical protein